jgi:hypothetical protein
MREILSISVIPSSAYFDLVTEDGSLKMQGKSAKGAAEWIADIKAAFAAVGGETLGETIVDTNAGDLQTPTSKQGAAIKGTGAISISKETKGSEKAKKKKGEVAAVKKSLVIGSPVGFVDSFGGDVTVKPDESDADMIAAGAGATATLAATDAGPDVDDPFSKFKSGKGTPSPPPPHHLAFCHPNHAFHHRNHA